jgi:GT2 family glycosyltransferase
LRRRRGAPVQRRGLAYNQNLLPPTAAVVVPTLNAGQPLEECLRSLERQSFQDFEVIVVDNSGCGRAKQTVSGDKVRLVENPRNLGFGAAVNQALRMTHGTYVAVLNDDAAAWPDWLGELVRLLEARPEAGMCASQIRLAGTELLDSAGMLLCADGSSKQRGRLQPPERYASEEEVLFPSGCAALYRRAMLEQIGGFDESFFLYSEDTDLGLRARWAGWRCLYAPKAVVEHRYSQTAGEASPLKAYYVERNRLYVVIKNFPCRALAAAPWAALARYFWHAAGMWSGRGAAARFRQEGQGGWKLPYYVLRAHLALIPALPRLIQQRRRILRSARITTQEFRALMKQHSISPREVALQ